MYCLWKAVESRIWGRCQLGAPNRPTTLLGTATATGEGSGCIGDVSLSCLFGLVS